MRVIIGIVLMVIAFILLFLFIGGPDNKFVADTMTSLTCQPGEHFIQVLGGYVYDSDGGGQEVNFYCQTETAKRDVTLQAVLIIIAAFVIPFLIGLALTITSATSRANRLRKQLMGSAIGFTPGTSAARLQTDPFGQQINPADLSANTPGQPIRSGTVITLNGQQINPADLGANIPGQPIRSGTVITLNGQQADLSHLPPETAQMVEKMLGRLGTMANNGAFTVQSASGGSLADKLNQLKDARDKGLITNEEYEKARKAILDHLGQ